MQPNARPSRRYHEIRLNGPWDGQLLSTNGEKQPETEFQLKVPAGWSALPELSTGVVFSRRFNCPTGLQTEGADATQVELFFAQVASPAELVFNDVALQTIRAADSVPIGSWLKNFNRMELWFRQGASSIPVFEGVTLRIFEPN